MSEANTPASHQPSTGNKPWNDHNHSVFEGRVGVKPEMRITRKNPVVSTTLYVNNEYDTDSGRKTKTTRIPIKLYGETGQAFLQTIDSGDRIKVEGKLEENLWKDQETQKNRSRLEMVAFQYSLLAKKKAA